MTYRGKVRNGVVVLDAPEPLPEGAELECIVITPGTKQHTPDDDYEFEYDEQLMKYSGVIKDAPPDAAANVDHYLYGHAKE